MGPVSIGVEVQRNTDGDTPSSPNHTHFSLQMSFGLNFISLYTHVQNDNVINTNEQVSDIQNGIQKEVLGLM